jgi:hypothetical protein
MVLLTKLWDYVKNDFVYSVNENGKESTVILFPIHL